MMPHSEEASLFLNEYKKARSIFSDYDNDQSMYHEFKYPNSEHNVYELKLPQNSIVYGFKLNYFDTVEILCDGISISTIHKSTALKLFGGIPHPALLLGFLVPTKSVVVVRIHILQNDFTLEGNYKYIPGFNVLNINLKFLQVAPVNKFRDRLYSKMHMYPKLSRHLFEKYNLRESVLCHNILVYKNGRCSLMFV